MSPKLSPREGQICYKASTGLTNKEIAEQLGIRQCTVDSYWRRIFEKLDARGRTHAVSLWLGSESGKARERESGPDRGRSPVRVDASQPQSERHTLQQ